MNVAFLHRLWVLYGKEWARLRRNPAALMAVGLLVLMAILVSIESKAGAKRAASAARQPCLVVYNEEDGLIKLLKAAQHKRVPVQFMPFAPDLGGRERPAYPAGLACAVEISRLDPAAQPQRRIVFRHAGIDLKQVHSLSDWVNTVGYFGTVHFATRPLPRHAADAPAGFDLSSSRSRAMVSAMLLFSAQFFVCCALFISFTAHERERGILQALALTPAGAGELLLAKMAFHLSLSLAASGVLTLVLARGFLTFPPLWLAFLASSFGLLAVAALITSFARSQTSASLAGFCYLMLVGVVFALSQNFPGFAALRELMFEHHAVSAYNALFDVRALGRRGVVAFFGHMGAALLLGSCLLALAAWVWRKQGWQAC